MQLVCCYFLELVTNDWFYLCYSTTVHCGGGANPGWGPSPPPPPTAWPSLNKLASSSQHSRQSQTSTRERDRIARPPSQLILGGWGVAPPPSQDRGRGWGGKTRPRGARRIYGREWFPGAPCTFLCTDPGIPESSHLQRQDTAWPMASHRWLEKEIGRTTEVSTW